MKTLILFSVIILSIGYVHAQYTTNIILSSQGQIDSFQVNYPGCTKIEGFLTIAENESGNILNLNGLSVLYSIGGSLNIIGNDRLVTLNGLENIATFDGDLIIKNNSSLKSLTGLGDILISRKGDPGMISQDSLNRISGRDILPVWTIRSVTIADNPLLSDCHVQGICNYLSDPLGSVNIYNNAAGCDNPGLITHECGFDLPCMPYGNYYFLTQAEIDNFPLNYPGCSELSGQVFIGLHDYNSNIENLTGLSSITSVNSGLFITNNDNLRNLEGLESLVSAYLVIYQNGALTDLSGLTNLSSGSYLTLSHNYALKSLEGLMGLDSLFNGLVLFSNIQLTDIGALDSLEYIGNQINIIDNRQLDLCNTNIICKYMTSGRMEINIRNNAPGCLTKETVAESCRVGLDEVVQTDDYFSIYPNPSTGYFTVEMTGTPSKHTFLSMHNLSGQELLNLPITELVSEIDVSGLPSGMYIVKVYNEFDFQLSKFIRQ
jgi:hypothetical protein